MSAETISFGKLVAVFPPPPVLHGESTPPFFQDEDGLRLNDHELFKKIDENLGSAFVKISDLDAYLASEIALAVNQALPSESDERSYFIKGYGLSLLVLFSKVRDTNRLKTKAFNKRGPREELIDALKKNLASRDPNENFRTENLYIDAAADLVEKSIIPRKELRSFFRLGVQIGYRAFQQVMEGAKIEIAA